MRFPEAEVEIAALAFKVASGLTVMPERFPSPPVPPANLMAKHDEYVALVSRIAMAKKTLRELHKEKDQVIAELQEWTTAELRYAETHARHTPEDLVGLGWAPPRAPEALTLPGSVWGFTVGAQGEKTVELSWRPPSNGGKVASYSVQRSTAGGKWEIALIQSGGTRVILDDQPRGVQLQYRVVGVNRIGEGPSSGVVNVVL